MRIYSAYDPPPARKYESDEPSLTIQSAERETDVNVIVAKYQKTGAITHHSKYAERYGYATSSDFKEAMDLVAEGQSMFEALPSSLRDKFNGSPEQFLDFVQDPENVHEAVELGLLDPREIEGYEPPPLSPVEAGGGPEPEIPPADGQSGGGSNPASPGASEGAS